MDKLWRGSGGEMWEVMLGKVRKGGGERGGKVCKIWVRCEKWRGEEEE